MKKVLAVLAIGMASIFQANAQTDKGDWIVGGSLNLSTPSNSTQFSITPEAMYFVANNFAVGGAINYTYNKAGNTKYNQFTIGPAARYYFNLKEDHIKPLVAAGVGFGSYSSKTGSFKTSSSVTSAYIGGGLAYFLNRNVAVEGIVSYASSKVKDLPASDGLNFNIGFRIHLAK